MKAAHLFRYIVHIGFFSVLVLVLFGGYFVEFVLNFKPCALCYLQRLGMLLSALCLLINLRNPGMQNLGVCLLSSVFGASVSLRHLSLKFCCAEKIQPLIFGKSLPLWAFYVFISSIFAVSLLLMIKDVPVSKKVQLKVFNTCFYVISFVLLIGVLSTFINRGLEF